MHEILWSTVNVHVLLNCGALCLEAFFCANLIFATLCTSDTEPKNLICNWIPNVELHCSNKCVTECVEPCLVEIRKMSISKACTPGEALPIKVSSAQHKDETSVEELANEYTVGNESHLGRLTILTNPLDNSDNNPSNNRIQNDDCILNGIVQDSCF